MDLGDSIREQKGHNYLASKAISDITLERHESVTEEHLDDRDYRSNRKCFIINSLKHPEELDAFQKVYGKSFYLLGVFSPDKTREDYLKKIIDREHHEFIGDLLHRDNNSRAKNGQKQRDVFVNSDYFIRYYNENSNEKLIQKLTLFTNLIFDFGVNTPTKEENAMHQAAAAAANSSCLSRQVGASITDNEGHILSMGWNDVPCAGGGHYPSSDKKGRCMHLKKCANSERKDEMVNNILTDLEQQGFISSTQITINGKSQSEIAKEILQKRGLKDLIEFGRSVHAEMSAIIIGSQKTGDRMVKGKLFSTTYPCHNCARHIIMAGITEVYYIEPYSKSLCLVLHEDAISEDETELDKVRILMYEGVAPKSFMRFYQLITDDRKSKILAQQKHELIPKHQEHLESLPEREIHYLKSVGMDVPKNNVSLQ